jgi:hypothetical protein
MGGRRKNCEEAKKKEGMFFCAVGGQVGLGSLILRVTLLFGCGEAALFSSWRKSTR